LKQQDRESLTKSTRILLDRQKRAYQVLVSKLRQEVRRLKFQRNSLMDPLLEMQYYPYLPRTPNTRSALKPLLGTIGQLPTKSTDYFVLNPPPAVGEPDEPNKFEGFYNGNPRMNDLHLKRQILSQKYQTKFSFIG
jgi:hypothetical protein